MLNTLVILLVNFGVAWQTAAPASPSAAQIVAQNCSSAVALVTTEDADGQPLKLGSGVVVAPKTIATNLHVIQGAAGARIKMIGSKEFTTVTGLLAADETNDLALLQIDSLTTPPLGLAVGPPAIGEEVFVIGNPRGLEGSISQGIVSGVRDLDASQLIQMTAPISPGSSGGPVLNRDQKIIGVAVAAIRDEQNLNFAIPVKYIRDLLGRSVPPTSLREFSARPKKPSVLDSIGTELTNGALAITHLTVEPKAFWGGRAVANYHFSVRNNLQKTVYDIRLLVVFYKGGTPIHSEFHTIRDSEESLFVSSFVTPGLAKRTQRSKTNKENSTSDLHGEMVEKVDVRIQSFAVVD